MCVVAVLDTDTTATPPPPPAADVKIDTFRGTGNGGQARNTTDSAVRVTHKPTGIVITRTSGRSQTENIADALAELGEKLAERARIEQAEQMNNTRREQADPVIAFTHNAFRDEVVRHATGQRWTSRAWAQGRLNRKDAGARRPLAEGPGAR